MNKYKYEKYKNKYLQLVKSLRSMQFGGISGDTNNMNFKGAGIAFISKINNEYHVLLAHDRRNGRNSNKIELEWGLFGGGREDNELPIECAFREFVEEFGNVKIPRNVLNEIINRCTANKKMALGTYSEPDGSTTYLYNIELLRTIFDVLHNNNINCPIFKKGWKEFYDRDGNIKIKDMCINRIRPSKLPNGGLHEINSVALVPIKELYEGIDLGATGPTDNGTNNGIRPFFRKQVRSGLFQAFGYGSKI
jgi:hypothetical protein